MRMESCGGHDSDSASTFTSEKGLDPAPCDGSEVACQDLEDDRKGSRRSAGKRTVKQALRQQAKRRRKNTSVAAGTHGPTPRLQAHGDVDEVEVEGGVQYRQPTMAEVLASIPGWRGKVVAAKGRARVRRLSAAAQLAQTEREGCVDLETPDSVLVTANLRQLLNKHTFSSLPPLYQYKLLQLLPRVDRAPAPHSSYLYRLSSLGLNNEFFARACMDWRERLAEGEFTPENQAKLKAEHDREKAKLDPWKLKHFEPMWGERLEEWPALGPEATTVVTNSENPVNNAVETPTTTPVPPTKKKRTPTPASRSPAQTRTPSRPLRTVGAVTRSLRQAASVTPKGGAEESKEIKLEEATSEIDIKEESICDTVPPISVDVVSSNVLPEDAVQSDDLQELVEVVKVDHVPEEVVQVESTLEVTSDKEESGDLVMAFDEAKEDLEEVKLLQASSNCMDIEEEPPQVPESSEVPYFESEQKEEINIPECASSPQEEEEEENETTEPLQSIVEPEETSQLSSEPAVESSVDLFVDEEPLAEPSSEFKEQFSDDKEELETVADGTTEEPAREQTLVEMKMEEYNANSVGPVVESIVTVDGTSYSIATSVAPGDPTGEQVVTTVSCVAMDRLKDTADDCQELNIQPSLSGSVSLPSPNTQADQLSSSWEVIKVDPDSAQSKEAVVDEEAILAAAWKAVSSHQLDQFTSNTGAMDEVSVIACQEELEVTLEESNRGCTDMTPTSLGGNISTGVMTSSGSWTPLPSAATLRPSGPSNQAGHVKLELEVTLTPESQVTSSSGNGGVGNSLPPVVAPPTLVCLSRRPPTPAPTPPPAAPPASALPCLALTTSTPVRAVAAPRPRPRPAPRPSRPPPGAVNLERSYQICQAVIENSPNRDQLQAQLRRPPGTIPTRPRPPSSQPQPLLVRRVFTSHTGVPVNMALLPNSSPSAAAQVRFSGVRRSNSAPPGGGAAAGIVRPSSGTSGAVTRPASVGLALARAPRDCACSLQPLRPCAKCGAFCHQDCISPSSLCIACHTN